MEGTREEVFESDRELSCERGKEDGVEDHDHQVIHGRAPMRSFPTRRDRYNAFEPPGVTFLHIADGQTFTTEGATLVAVVASIPMLSSVNAPAATTRSAP